MNNVCIKGVRKYDWIYFKSEAAKGDKTMGEFFTEVLNKYKECSKDNWDEILYGPPTLTKSEAKDIRESIKDFKGDYDFE